jgi:hypothetical protein
VEDFAPSVDRFVGGQEHGPLVKVALVNDLVEEIGRLRGVGDVTDFINDQDVYVGVNGEYVSEVSITSSTMKMVDEVCESDEVGFASVLDGSVGNGNGKVGLSSSGRATKDEATAFKQEFGAEKTAEQFLTRRGLKREVELFNGA